MQQTVTIKARPIPFNNNMVRALQAGTKTQTRRALSSSLILNDEPGRYKFHYYGECDGIAGLGACFEDLRPEITPWIKPIPCPYGEPGDHLYVREEHYLNGYWQLLDKRTRTGKWKQRFVALDDQVYHADNAPSTVARGQRGIHKRLARFMFRKHSRLLLEITAVRCERLQDISEADAVAEGVESCIADLARFGARARGMKLYRDYGRKENSLTSERGTGFSEAVPSYETLWEAINGPDSWAANPWVWVVAFKIIPTT